MDLPPAGFTVTEILHVPVLSPCNEPLVTLQFFLDAAETFIDIFEDVVALRPADLAKDFAVNFFVPVSVKVFGLV